MINKIELVNALNEVLREPLGGPISELAGDEQLIQYCIRALAHIQAHNISVDSDVLDTITLAYINWDILDITD